MRGRHSDSAFVDRCKYVPLRLTESERLKLGTLIAALKVSEYTDEVDTFSRRSKSNRIVDAIHDVLCIASGLAVSGNPSKGKQLLRSDLRENAEFFRDLFEIGRRHKIMNPSKMRSEYGKLMYMMQDAQSRGAREALGFSCVAPLKMVSTTMKDPGALWDERMPVATGWHAGDKKSARKELVQEYGEEIERIMDSIDDARCYEEFNVQPVDDMLRLLETRFDPKEPSAQKPASLSLRQSATPLVHGSSNRANMSSDDEEESDDEDLSLTARRPRFGSRFTAGISRFASGIIRDIGGNGGASPKLTHSHPTQFVYVRQSLLLWREIMRNMYKLWHLADADLLGGQGGYQLWNTGQGLNRVQSCPRVAAEMRRILGRAQKESGQAWVGLSVVHLGDRDVPNALVFIDKYTQVPRILAPVALVVKAVNQLCLTEPAVLDYCKDAFGSPKILELEILADFFKHAFDGDGDDGGSCIDGRLTSAWNWCSKIAKKPYFHFFSMAGFVGFDGSYKDD